MTAGQAQQANPRYSLVEIPRSQAHLYNEQYYRGKGNGGHPAVGFVVPIMQFPNPHKQPGRAPAEDGWTMLQDVAREHGWTIGETEKVGSKTLHWVSDGRTFGMYAEVDTYHPAKRVTFHTSAGLIPEAIEELRRERGHWYLLKTANPAVERVLAEALERQLSLVASSLRDLLAELGKQIDARTNLAVVEASSEAVDEARAVLAALNIRHSHLADIVVLRRAAEQMTIVRDLLGTDADGLSDIEAVVLFNEL